MLLATASIEQPTIYRSLENEKRTSTKYTILAPSLDNSNITTEWGRQERGIRKAYPGNSQEPKIYVVHF